jgi:signal recognition particle receptor subunit beta
MTETRVVVVGAPGAGKQALLDSLGQAPGGQRLDDVRARVILAGGETLEVTCLEQVAGLSLPPAAGLLALVDAAADDAHQQLQACLALLSGPAAMLPAVLGLSRVDLRPEWDLAGTAATLAQAGATLPVVPFDARQASQALMLLDVLVSQIETHGLLGG